MCLWRVPHADAKSLKAVIAIVFVNSSRAFVALFANLKSECYHDVYFVRGLGQPIRYFLITLDFLMSHYLLLYPLRHRYRILVPLYPRRHSTGEFEVVRCPFFSGLL